MKVLIFGGGGLKAGFQAAAWLELKEAGWVPDAIFGVSAGAINGAMVSAGRGEEALELWKTISRDQVLKSHSKVRTAFRLFRPWKRKLGIYSTKPLRKTLEQHLGPTPEFKIPFYVGMCFLGTGRFTHQRMDIGTEQFEDGASDPLEALMASSAIPVAFEPVRMTRYFEGVGLHTDLAVDGGVRDNTPIGAAVELGATELVVITTNKREPEPVLVDELDTLPETAGRAFDMLFKENFVSDYAALERINNIIEREQRMANRLKQIVAQSAAKPGAAALAAEVLAYAELLPHPEYRHVPTTLIEPSVHLGGTLDADPELMAQRLYLGAEAGRGAVAELKAVGRL